MELTSADPSLLSSNGLSMFRRDITDESFITTTKETKLSPASLVFHSSTLETASTGVLGEGSSANPRVRAFVKFTPTTTEGQRGTQQT